MITWTLTQYPCPGEPGLNRELIARLVSDIRDAVFKAKGIIERPFEELGLHERLALRYLIIELVESSATLCAHLLKSLRGIYVEGYTQCFTRLGEAGIIPEDLAGRLAMAARLRNLVVHRYWMIDDRRVYESVKRGLGDFEFYANLVEEVSGLEA